MEKIAIVGVGPVGVSMGLALMDRRLSNTEIVITSGDRNTVSAVSKLGAANKTTTSMRDAVEDAHLVILDAPISEQRDIMDTFGPYVASGAVVTDTSNIKAPVMKWAEEFLPRDTNFISGYPLLKSPPDSIESSDADIFSGARYTITPTKSSDEQSIRTVVGLVEALRARPVFLDPRRARLICCRYAPPSGAIVVGFRNRYSRQRRLARNAHACRVTVQYLR